MISGRGCRPSVSLTEKSKSYPATTPHTWSRRHLGPRALLNAFQDSLDSFAPSPSRTRTLLTDEHWQRLPRM